MQEEMKGITQRHTGVRVLDAPVSRFPRWSSVANAFRFRHVACVPWGSRSMTYDVGVDRKVRALHVRSVPPSHGCLRRAFWSRYSHVEQSAGRRKESYPTPLPSEISPKKPSIIRRLPYTRGSLLTPCARSSRRGPNIAHGAHDFSGVCRSVRHSLTASHTRLCGKADNTQK